MFLREGMDRRLLPTGRRRAAVEDNGSMKVAGLVLAAGAGRRFGRPKALIELDGELLVERAANTLCDAGCSPVHVVLGAAATEVHERAELSRFTTITNEQWSTGMASSLQCGLSSLPEDVDAVVVSLVDQPWIGADVVKRLMEQDGAVVVATYDGRRRNPVLLRREVWTAVADAAHDDVGARAYITRHPDEVTGVECADLGSPADIDTPEDLP